MAGQYAAAGFYLYPTWLGSTDSWQAMILEGRIYPLVTRPNAGVLALWARGWFTLGRPPYMELPAIGWDPSSRTGRGYVQGRIRAENLVYFEAEYRVSLSRRRPLGGGGVPELHLGERPGHARPAGT